MASPDSSTRPVGRPATPSWGDVSMTETSTLAVFDVSAFCTAHKISRSFFYRLISEGRGPRLLKLGKRTLISVEAAAEWRMRIEQESIFDAPAVEVPGR